MPQSITSARPRGLIAAVVTLLAVVAALVVAFQPAQAAPGRLQPLNLTGACNGAAWAMAEAIDAKLKADGSALRMIQADQPKKGETGYNDGTVVFAYLRLAVLLRKPVGQLTADDVKNNAAQVAQAIDDALTFRRVNMRGDYPLSQTDDAGNKVFLWCLKANADHGGPDLGLLFVPKGKTPADGKWIAGCVLAGGMNEYKFSVDDKTFEFTKFVWYNIGPDPDNANRYIRYIYTYDVAKNELTIVKEMGPIQRGVPQAPDKTEKEKNPGAPPAEFKDLKLNGVQISLLDGDSALPARTTVLASADPVMPNMLTLTNSPATEPVGIIGVDETIEPGETLVLAVPNGTIPVADGPNPDWTLLTPAEPDSALFQYTGLSRITIPAGGSIPGVAILGTAPPTSPPPTSTPPVTSPPTSPPPVSTPPPTSPIPTTATSPGQN